MKILKVNSFNFREQILNSERLVLVEFGAEWCPPCKRQRPVLEEIAEEYKEKIIVGILDVGESPEIAEEYSVINVPQILVFKKGERVSTLSGFQPKSKLISVISNLT
ncbi:MAG: thioredoxin domain-containing protein [Acidobacteriota bacterium]